ncbi:MAG: hypothetical protein H6807_10380 [Planctomycetes bacterium]|nr:hypothetical protein [Planctomycetota bacterium]
MNEASGDACPYCGTIHPAGTRERGYYRCHGCNFHVHESWLVDEPEAWALDDVHRLLCPWCGFPAGSEQEFAAGRASACGGCGGSLEVDMLVTQADLRVDRDLGRRRRHLYLLFLSLGLLALIFLALAR